MRNRAPGDDAAVPVAYVALGSNLDDPLTQLRAAAAELVELGRSMRLSPIYQTAPVGGPADQPPYLNAVAQLEPHPAFLQPATLLLALLDIEKRRGRERRERWGPRRIDLDLLALGTLVLGQEGLVLPHPRMMERAFVLAPLCDLAPSWQHPVTGETPCHALGRLGSKGVMRVRARWVAR